MRIRSTLRRSFGFAFWMIKFLTLVMRAIGRFLLPDAFFESRFWRYTLVPLICLTVITGSTLVYYYARHKHDYLHFFAILLRQQALMLARILPLVMLIRFLDHGPEGRFSLRVSWTALVASIIAFTAAFLAQEPLASYWKLKGSVIFHAALFICVLSGILGTVPTRELFRRMTHHRLAVCLAATFLLPDFHRFYSDQLWKLSLTPTLADPIQSILNWHGFASHTLDYQHKRYGYSTIIRTDFWEITISYVCSVNSEITKFIAFFSAMLLSNPARMRLPMIVLGLFIAGSAGLFLINAARLADVIAFASHAIQAGGRTEEIYRQISAYHEGTGVTGMILLNIFMAVYFIVASRLLDQLITRKLLRKEQGL